MRKTKRLNVKVWDYTAPLEGLALVRVKAQPLFVLVRKGIKK